MIRVASSIDQGLSLDAIQIDGGTQSRASLYQNVVDDYAAAISEGANFPPIVVFYDGTKHWLADGFHRFHAYQKVGRTTVAADIRQGTRREAILFSVGANEAHGLRRTNEDKRRAVLTLLNDGEWSKWSDGEVAKRCAVSREYVNRLRPKDTCDQVTGMERTFVHPKTGEPAQMDVSRSVRAFDPHQAREHVEAAKIIRAEKQASKAETRDEKEAALADKMRAAAESLGQGRFGVIYADPPWRFEPYSRDTGMDRAADNHYPTMPIDEIVALDVPAADDCVLFLWATAPMLPDALNVLLEWGFTYKSQIIWLKDRIGTGYWARNKHEILLIGTRGNIPAPAPGTQPDSVIVAPVGAHSAKPVVFAELIERLFPNLPKIEMFARTSRPGWHGWGAEANSPDPQDSTVADGQPGIPSSPAGGEKTDVPSVGGQVGDEPGRYITEGEQEDASAAQDRNEPVSASGATVTNFESGKDVSVVADMPTGSPVAAHGADESAAPHSIPQPNSSQAADQTGAAPPPAAPVARNPQCQKPDTCKWARAQFSCSDCANAAMRAKQVAV